MKKLSIIIVNYNTKEILLDCLENLQNSYSNLQVIVVDNGSSDESASSVKKKYPHVVLIQTTNEGLAKGYNKGLKKANGDYILFMGTDAFPKKGDLAKMINYMDVNPKVGIATGKLVLRDGTVDMDAHRGFPTPWAAITHFCKLNRIFSSSKLFNQYFLGYKNINKPHEIDACISHFMLVTKKVFSDVPKWDEDYFLYGEDIDFCYKVKQSGWKVMYLPQFEVLHYKGVSVGIRKQSQDITRADKHTKIKMLKRTTESMQIFYKKHYENKYPKIVTRIVFVGIKILGWVRVNL